MLQYNVFWKFQEIRRAIKIMTNWDFEIYLQKHKI